MTGSMRVHPKTKYWLSAGWSERGRVGTPDRFLYCPCWADSSSLGVLVSPRQRVMCSYTGHCRWRCRLIYCTPGPFWKNGHVGKLLSESCPSYWTIKIAAETLHIHRRKMVQSFNESRTVGSANERCVVGPPLKFDPTILDCQVQLTRTSPVCDLL